MAYNERIGRDIPEASEFAPGAALRGLFSRGRRGSAPPESDRVTELERLARLKEAGVLTDEELAAEKPRLL